MLTTAPWNCPGLDWSKFQELSPENGSCRRVPTTYLTTLRLQNGDAERHSNPALPRTRSVIRRMLPDGHTRFAFLTESTLSLICGPVGSRSTAFCNLQRRLGLSGQLVIYCSRCRCACRVIERLHLLPTGTIGHAASCR